MRRFQILLACLTVLVGLSAVAGGIGLVWTNGLGMPLSWLHASWFASYIWPGLILVFVVGGTQLTAARLLWRKSPHSEYALATAGLALLIWIFVEMYSIAHPSWLQAACFFFAILIIVLTMVYIRLKSLSV